MVVKSWDATREGVFENRRGCWLGFLRRKSTKEILVVNGWGRYHPIEVRVLHVIFDYIIPTYSI